MDHKIKSPPFFRTQHNYDSDMVTVETGLDCRDPSLAQQSSAEETDINTIVNRYLRSGVLPLIPLPPTQDEFAEIFDFRTAMDTMLEAEKSFKALPADVRRRFDNNPAEFVDFCSNRDNLPEMRKMGLAVPEEPAIMTAPPTPEGNK